jgi:hypothetical protein
MSYQVILHLANSEPILAEIEELPGPTDTLIKIKNPTMVDGKDITYIRDDTTTILWPIERINFLEVVSEEENEKIFGFVRE